MLFNSLEFALFLPIVFALYWLLNKHLRWQNLLVVVASYIFYGWWDWRFLVLIAFTSLCSWGSGLLIEKFSKPKIWLTLNIVINLLILGIFKYFNFFVDSFCDLFGITNSIALKVILPVGISFYTFQALSYSIDVYRKRIASTHDVVAFFAYVSFFPQLVAGPIERATNLLPQFENIRHFDYDLATDGMRQILWGLFKKVVVADTCATYVDQVFANPIAHSASTLLIGAVFFTFQIYGDFSGYSDMAIGTAKLFGIRLMRNFQVPFFSRDIAEFWRRWHMSLTTWFRDYVYIPLGGSRVSTAKVIRNTLIIFVLSGMWHGTNWTYVAWGCYHAVLFIPLIILRKNRRYLDTPNWKQIPRMLGVFFLCTIGWVIFRSDSIYVAWCYLHGLVGEFTMPEMYNKSVFVTIIGSVLMLLAVEWMQRDAEHGLSIKDLSPMLRWGIYSSVLTIILLFGGHSNNFIYFQF